MSAAKPEDSIDVEPARVEELLAEDPELQLIDVRESYEHEAGHIEGTRLIELLALTSEAATLDPERALIFYCRTGSRSTMAAQAFRAAGFEAYSMSGGLVRWSREERPLHPVGGTVANH